jgi:CRISPR/Cas system-associated endonuclease Cas1
MYYTSRYEKLNRKIDLWEAKKREKARRKLDISEVDNIMTLYNLIS